MMWIQCAAGIWMNSAFVGAILDVENEVVAGHMRGDTQSDTLTILKIRTYAEASAAADELARLLNWYERGCPDPAPYLTTWAPDGSLRALQGQAATPEPMTDTDRHTLAPPRRMGREKV